VLSAGLLLPRHAERAEASSTIPKAPRGGCAVPHRGIDPWCPPATWRSQLHATFRPRRSSRPRRFAPPRVLWVCFTPQPRPGFSLQGFGHTANPIPVILGRCPHAVSATTPVHPRTTPATVTRSSRALLPAVSVTSLAKGVNLDRTTRPSWVFSPPGPEKRTVATLSRDFHPRP
jgi:hypothetical protein